MKLMMAEFHLAASVSGIVHAGSLSHCHDLLGHLKRMESLLMLLVTPVIFEVRGLGV